MTGLVKRLQDAAGTSPMLPRRFSGSASECTTLPQTPDHDVDMIDKELLALLEGSSESDSADVAEELLSDIPVLPGPRGGTRLKKRKKAKKHIPATEDGTTRVLSDGPHVG
ncbi:hypothetical protein L210DRAFT_3638565 [Boletus edulis BED1]|uniref:Uncharacterized protein n=1 Tax=Boletus edulis BED1 TaxID=1328754 RepID=A0AAD4C7Q7_BOLED|nr:hypothetical protein L210DRAFT_3638565 [Boletus edulis BED1]